MLKIKLNLKNVIAIAIFLSSTVMFLGCDSETPGQGIPPLTEQTLTKLHMFVETGERVTPVSFDPVSWEKDTSGKFIKYFDYEDINYSDNSIKLTKIIDYSNAVAYDTLLITLDNGRAKQTQHSTAYIYTNDYQNRTIYLLNYYYDEQGFLSRVTDLYTRKGEQDVLQITVENENITKIKKIDYSVLDGEIAQETTYDYTYDNNTFVPMSDWAPFTPLHVARYMVTLYDDLLGQKSKNNVISVDMQYQSSEYPAHFNKITYELEYNEQDKLAAIKHTGRITGDRGSGGNQIDFDNVKTIFDYTNK